MITASTLVSLIERGMPERGSSRRPSSRCAMKRVAIRDTVWGGLQLPRNHLVGITRCAGEHDAGSQRESLRRRSRPAKSVVFPLQPCSK